MSTRLQLLLSDGTHHEDLQGPNASIVTGYFDRLGQAPTCFLHVSRTEADPATRSVPCPPEANPAEHIIMTVAPVRTLSQLRDSL